ncbi:MAG: hypothetical protein UIL36_00845 [Turicibacter sp.]|nr:hypothetical protein [Turicibacter sp.]
MEKCDGYAHKCIGIPMYPEECHFNMERPEGITDEHIESKRKNVDRFFERNGFILPKTSD